MIRHATVQRTAEIVMVLGIIALCQPWNFFLHRYGLTIIIAGLLTFMITGWVGPRPNQKATGATERDGHS
ncbi:hypothetical protein SAMN04488498_101120 [Mesorhizobium albiziae]|uniref:Uncharacterized protein n=1 Tax=Neomesorhizobium albiziae TaxID=335020 RepID=A0A1I3V095_9HYPH|nr:hypothetical protein [Mesorhizobium albiziae]GLS28581.1 hypothetical protein GCM10007937_02880 [Mesorhizobium albiziae]SFJ88655.1 hypothetical protein SAMN04488498_101120 [Mesorhizobium albiziae]